ncbi:hypothetical protein K458DRAFT_317677 [Lentithecium fluviatile CBS 122367]|uniref:Uncharacterized protein n=1 Tax=Lentithecium fluviatile CBS 122367 TaxID=1168545 RepID=A0A6G1IJA2_9PLEO|nr:hypothetical protein K458DRAFT_317677 [Lentithecium fluviatile CBS 122367]
MRFLALLPLLAATTLATEALFEATESASEAAPTLSTEATTTGDSSASSSSSSSLSAATASSTEEPTPVGQLWTAQWSDADLKSLTKKCTGSTTHKAEIYTLKEMYPRLKQWAAELKVFYHKQLYPGSWEGVDVHGDGRELLKMPLEELPFAVREWLKKTPKQRHFSVQDDVVFFAPGAIYPILPLFVDESDDKGCDGKLVPFHIANKPFLIVVAGVFEDLDSYSPTAKDGAVLGKVSHKKTKKNEVEITVEAFQVTKGAGGRDEL